MPRRCLSCGELAVIEESVDGGKDQLICIECGTLADTSQATKASDFADNDNDDLLEDNLADKSNTGQLECISCGIELDNCNEKLCSDCAELDEAEISENKEERQVLDNEDLPISQNSHVKDESVEIFQGGATEDSKPKCSSCGCYNLVYDSINGDDRLICTDCGQVNSDAILSSYSYSSIADCNGTTSSKYYRATLPTFADHLRVQQGIQVGLSQISKLCTKFCFQPNLKSEAEEMYKTLYCHPKILNIKNDKKECIAAFCLFFICRQCNMPISITHFKQDVPCYTTFLKMKKFLYEKLQIVLPPLSATAQITEIIDRLQFDHKLLNKMKDILFLFRKAWVSQGRNRSGLVAMAAYYAFVSSDKCTKYITWKTFVKKHKLDGTSQPLVRNCQTLMCKLASSLPWLKSKIVTPRALPCHVNNVLEYKESLFHLVYKPTQTSEPPDVRMSDNEFGSISGKKRPLVPNSQKEELLPSSSKKSNLNTTMKKEPYFTIPSNVNLDSPILKETEFDDVEISSYILSAEEQERIKDIKMKIMSNNFP